MQIIAADVGGTKTRLACADSEAPHNVLHEARYLSSNFDGFEPMLETFIQDCEIAGTMVDANEVNILSLALPGLVGETSVRLTNLPWTIEKQKLKENFGIENVYFINDFQASVFGTDHLLAEDLVILNSGFIDSYDLQKNSTRVAVGAGTGLGIAWADEVQGGEQTVCSHDSEGGHIDFAPTNDTQIALLKFLQQRFDRVSYERILSGDGLVSLYQFFADSLGVEVPGDGVSAEWVNKRSENDEAADRAVSLFVQIYGAYIGNIALLFKPYGGIYITGGIAAKMLKKMQSEEFIGAYLGKGRMRVLVEQIKVYLVTNDRIGVLGAMSEAIKLQHGNIRNNSVNRCHHDQQCKHTV